MAEPQGEELQAIRRRQDELKQQYLLPAEERPKTAARGVHHAVYICRNVEETIVFYQEVMGFPLVDISENRDYPGSSHFFFDIGNQNTLAFFDFPGHPHGDYEETIGGSHHLALSVTSENFTSIRSRLNERGILFRESSGGDKMQCMLVDPNGLRVELLNEGLGYISGRYVL